MRWARIDSSQVIETTTENPGGRFHESLSWVECPDEVHPGWNYNGRDFSAPRPIEVNKPTASEVELERLRAYADPVTGSDRHFAEAQREKLMGNLEAADSARASGIARFAEIQEQYPWP